MMRPSGFLVVLLPILASVAAAEEFEEVLVKVPVRFTDVRDRVSKTLVQYRENESDIQERLRDQLDTLGSHTLTESGEVIGSLTLEQVAALKSWLQYGGDIPKCDQLFPLVVAYAVDISRARSSLKSLTGKLISALKKAGEDRLATELGEAYDELGGVLAAARTICDGAVFVGYRQHLESADPIPLMITIENAAKGQFVGRVERDWMHKGHPVHQIAGRLNGEALSAQTGHNLAFGNKTDSSWQYEAYIIGLSVIGEFKGFNNKGKPGDELIASYLQAVERGEESDQSWWIVKHPEYADDLRAFFKDYSRVRHQVAAAEAELPDTTVDKQGLPIGASPRIGNFKLLQLLGTGGMGEVWMAEQEKPVRRRVALKLIKQGMDSRAVLARFDAERQTLALMNHPNIAKVFEAGIVGAEDHALGMGRPYFVMELVKGIPITEFCDSRRLQIRERLKLFCQCCNALHHAHQRGIIHRDLKPSNILVESHDDEPVLKVIDFGLSVTGIPPFSRLGPVVCIRRVISCVDEGLCLIV